MEIMQKLQILSDAAKYDVSCSSSGSSRSNNGGLGNGHMSGICHSWSEDGRCISLLKILLTNSCVYDCAYCVNRITNDLPRATFTPEEVVSLTINFYRRNYIEGLFLSSAVYKNPDYTMEQLLQTVKILRTEHNFNGYIHLKAIPGADSSLIYEAGLYVDRMSVNIELPSNEGLKFLAPQKKKETILKPMGFIKNQITEKAHEKMIFKHSPKFVPAGQTTQLIVGATPDHDISILRLSENLYNHFKLKRVYFSAYVPVSNNPRLPGMADQNWIIHDIKRNSTAIYNMKEWILTGLELKDLPAMSLEEEFYQSMWKQYFKSIAITTRLNPKLQVQYMPRRYWSHLIEKQ